MDAPRQDGPIFSFYGDDFTGSTDALEALTTSGVPSVLFLHSPDDGELAEFGGYRGIGIAGDSRSRSPEAMRETLPAVFERLRQIGAPVVQYKVCSTFDSSPEVGSIGCALDIGRTVFDASYVPVVAAAPMLRRYVAFGNLFADGDDAIVRIDRHPTMSRHPVTPMDEADLRLHLAKQTSCRIALFDLLALRAGDAAERLSRTDADAILFDGLNDEDQTRVAQLIWNSIQAPQVFAVGSSGFTYGMLAYWRAQGWLAPAETLPRAGAADRLLVVAGSCSPATGRQICWALRNGFTGIRLDPVQPLEHEAVSQALSILASGSSVVVYSALSPDDSREVADREGLASAMGRILREITVRSAVRRVVVAGGDTSSHAVRQTGIAALSFLAPLQPGAPLCRAHGGGRELHGLELVLKGGQVGRESFFGDVLQGDTR